MKDAEEKRVIFTKRRMYILPVSAAKTFEERYPGAEKPAAFNGGRFWETPDGWVFARPDEEQPF